MMAKSAVLGRRALVAGVAVGLSGCGFRPVYATRGTASGAQRELAEVDVALIPERGGQLLRQFLQQRFDRGDAVAKRFTLSVSYGVAGDTIGVQQDSSTTRTRLTGTGTWYLKQLNPAQTVVTSGVARALDGVNIIDQQYFAADLEGETAGRRIAEAIADQITLQIASYFDRHPTAA
jgi:LPS-assembly lipoprotein